MAKSLTAEARLERLSAVLDGAKLKYEYIEDICDHAAELLKDGKKLFVKTRILKTV